MLDLVSAKSGVSGFQEFEGLGFEGSGVFGLRVRVLGFRVSGLYEFRVLGF